MDRAVLLTPHCGRRDPDGHARLDALCIIGTDEGHNLQLRVRGHQGERRFASVEVAAGGRQRCHDLAGDRSENVVREGKLISQLRDTARDLGKACLQVENVLRPTRGTLISVQSKLSDVGRDSCNGLPCLKVLGTQFIDSCNISDAAFEQTFIVLKTSLERGGNFLSLGVLSGERLVPQTL